MFTVDVKQQCNNATSTLWIFLNKKKVEASHSLWLFVWWVVEAHWYSVYKMELNPLLSLVTAWFEADTCTYFSAGWKSLSVLSLTFESRTLLCKAKYCNHSTILPILNYSLRNQKNCSSEEVQCHLCFSLMEYSSLNQQSSQWNFYVLRIFVI